MYLRHSTKQKKGKPYTYWRLVRSVRRNGKVVQETVAQLGEIDAQGQINAKDLCTRITGGTSQLELWEENPAPETIAVRLDRIRVERSRDFGDVWLGWPLWKALQLDTLCTSLMPAGKESVAWSTMAAVLVIARLCEPSSELHIAEDWYRKTALEDILDLPAARVNDDRLYRAHDHLLPHKEAIERHLRTRIGELFSIDYDLLLYDVTSTYFEGLAEKNDLAQRGHSRDHRSDCKQVCIALVVTREGIPLGYELFPGNKSDMTTVKGIVDGMEKRFGIAQRVWVMDRGMGSDANVGAPQFFGGPICDVRAQHITSFAFTSPIIPIELERPHEFQPAGFAWIIDDLYSITASRAFITAKKSPDLPLECTSVNKFFRARKAPLNAFESFFDSFRKSVMHGRFLFRAIRRPTNDECLGSFRAQFDLQPLTNQRPSVWIQY